MSASHKVHGMVPIRMNCPHCKKVTDSNHIHDAAHGIPETHMSGSERYECRVCKHALFKKEGESQGLEFMLD